jgi:WXG100 family type VII secretion target
MDLLVNRDAFSQASRDLQAKCQELRTLRTNINASFDQLRIDWDTDAGRKFFERFESILLKNLEDYSNVFEYMSKNLTIASQRYEEVFNAADNVANVQY